MLDRKTMLAVLALVLLMLASAIWLVGHMERWLIIPFLPPACVMIVLGALHWRFAHAKGDLSAWTKFGSFFAISYAAICAGYELILVMRVLNVTAPTTFLSLIRLLFAFLGVQFFVLGNWIAKLPPLGLWRPASLSLNKAGEAAMLRFRGWLMVAYGVTLVASAFLIPMSLITPLVVSMSLALLIVALIRRRQLKAMIG
jgi:hypothetical protein